MIWCGGLIIPGAAGARKFPAFLPMRLFIFTSLLTLLSFSPSDYLLAVAIEIKFSEFDGGPLIEKGWKSMNEPTTGWEALEWSGTVPEGTGFISYAVLFKGVAPPWALLLG